MNEKIYSVTAGSEHELSAKLSADLKTKKFDYDFISISFNDPKIYVHPFHLPKAAHPQLLTQLKGEANQLLSLKEADIELDYQIFQEKNDMLDGLFICTPRKTLEHYVRICDHAGLIPVNFTANILTCIGALYAKHKGEAQSFCILEFTRDKCVNLAVFCSNKCEFIRRLKNDNPREARGDIIQSIRSASAKSKVKNIEHIYVSGEIGENQGLIEDLVNDTGAQLTQEECAQEQRSSFHFHENYFQVNLVRNYSFALARRKQFMLASHAVLGVLGVFVLIGLINFIRIQGKIAKVKSNFSASDLQYARELQTKLDSLTDAN